METIKKTPKGQLRSSLRDEVVFVAFFKMTKDAFALMERFLKFDNKNMRPKFDEVRQKVLQQIQRLFSNKIHNVHLEQSHLLPDLEKQEELYALLLPKLKETHGRFKKL
ncbi:hypothetical protein VARIO8X_120038 [Burkholderiales bacterium 8X]|nr:hypothetical protein VARIO8X_120038 [Burkholderiales bacterium 8X]